MDRHAAIKLLSEPAREQAGYVTTGQAKRLGLKTGDLVGMARRGDLRRVIQGVYALPATFGGPREDVIAGWLRLVGERLPWDRELPSAIASHATAASIHGFGTFPPTAPTFTVMRRRFQPPDGSIHLYKAHLDPEDWEWSVLPESVNLPVTTPARTVVDLAFAGEDPAHVLDALAEARERGLVDDATLVDAIDRRRSRGGRGSVSWLADLVSQ
jgi:predicted transcriptional regulator of viral defense system